MFNSPIRGSYDMVEAMMVLFVFNGMSTAFLQRRNIVIDLIDSFVPRGWSPFLIRLADVLTIAALALFTYAMTHAGAAVLQLRRASRWNSGCRSGSCGQPPCIGIAGAILCAIGAFLLPAISAR